MSFQNYSVLMSVYNKENPEYLKLSIESMLNQTIKPSEFIIVKDGQLNDSLDEVISHYEEKCTFFKVISIENNVGLGKALDIGLQHCSYELVARMDSDDISISDRCEKQLNVYEKYPRLSIVGTLINEFSNSTNNLISSRWVPEKPEDISKYIKRKSPFNHPSVMFKKSDVLLSGGYGKLARKQDLDLFSRMINKGLLGYNIQEALVLFRSNEDSFNRRKSWSYCKSYIEVQVKIYQRGDCSLLDLIYVICGQMILYVSPIGILKYISKNYLRNKPV